MPRPNHPTEAAFHRALANESHYRIKCLKLEEERDTLLALLEDIVDLNLGCPSLEDKRKADAIFAAAREAIDKTKTTGGE